MADSCLSSSIETFKVEPYFYKLQDGKRIFLIDTPGFNDAIRSDSEILQEIAFFLAQTYLQSIRLTGVVYLHRITDNRMSGSSLRNLQIFRELCGQSAYPHVALTTTMWDALQDPGEGANYQNQLLSHGEWWGDMVRRQSHVARHDGKASTAESIIQNLISHRDPDLVLAIQREMVLQKKSLEDTSAGLETSRLFRAVQDKKRSELGTVQERIQVARRARHDNAIEDLESQESELRSELEKAKQAQQALKINCDRLVKDGEEQYRKLLLDGARERQENEKAIKVYEEELLQLKASQEAAFEEIKTYRGRLERTEKEIRASEQERRAVDLERLTGEKTALEERIKELEQQQATQGAEQQGKRAELENEIEKGKKRRKRDIVMPIFHTLSGIGTAIVTFFSLGGAELFESK